MLLARVMVPAAMLLGLAPYPPTRPSADPPRVVANDNRVPAGRLAGDSLVIALEVRNAVWYPDEENGAHATVAAFAEVGRAPMIPGPLIRVREGTTIVARLRNSLSDSSLHVRGFFSRPASKREAIILAPGEERVVRFMAGAPGTYFYEADVGEQNDAVEREQLAGAFIVDPPGGSPPDRVFVMNIWGDAIDSVWQNALAINGKSWPYTERIQAVVGDSIRWRVINPTVRPHPMHLHGVYFRQDARGTIAADTAWNGDDRQLVVTSLMRAGSTLSMAWRPDRPGNWLFHCHLMFHAASEARLNPDPHAAHSADADRHMAGLVLGIQAATPPGWVEEPRGDARRLSLYVQEGARRHRGSRALGFVLGRGRPPAIDSVEQPGSLLVLTRDQPTDITVHNRMREPTAVHWHGIELESWSDGVPGWSGIGTRLAPMIAPGDSFVARLTLPRAGTFIYHTHLNDIEQVTSGLYGPIVVLEPGQRFDPATDHLFLSSWDGGAEPPHVLINGDSLPRDEKLAAGVPHRFRFINIEPAGPGEYRLLWQFSGIERGPVTLLRRYTVE